MKRIIINILVIAFVSLCHYWTYRTAYIEGYKQAIKDEIEYIESQTDSINGEIRLLDRAIVKFVVNGRKVEPYKWFDELDTRMNNLNTYDNRNKIQHR